MTRALKRVRVRIFCHRYPLSPIFPAIRLRLFTSTLVLGWLAAPLTIFGASPANIDWPVYLGDKGRSLYSPLAQINRTNVAQLKIAWTYATGDKAEYQANNLIIAGVLYTASPTR